VLVVDDDTAVTEPLTYLLEQAGFGVSVATSGPEALASFESIQPDMVLLEWQLPGTDGAAVCAALRRRSAVPIIVLTAADEEVDKVHALEVGADDYVGKPFSSRELTARIEAVLRRYQTAGADTTVTPLTAGPVRMDLDRHRVLINGIETSLRLKEFTVLEYLVRNHSQVVTRDQLIERIWGEHYDGDPKRMDAIIRRLRDKVEPDPAEPRHLLTIRQVGYRFDP
jgi:two-component system response regulator RegX3